MSKKMQLEKKVINNNEKDLKLLYNAPLTSIIPKWLIIWHFMWNCFANNL